MAMIDNAQKVPFGAVSTYRISSALYGVAEDVLSWNARRTMAAEFRKLTPTELEDIGLSAASADMKDAGFFGRIVARIRHKVDTMRTVRELDRLSPKLLDDIGLTRAHVEFMRDRASLL
ncbi:MAG: DUF1127 domain-containing protein [Pseudomonadota bacterium]